MKQIETNKENLPKEIIKSWKLFSFLVYYWIILLFIYILYPSLVILVFSICSIDNGLITFISFMVFVLITLTISYYVIIKIIILTNKTNKKIPKFLKIKLFLSPLTTTLYLVRCFKNIREWDYSKFKVDNANVAFQEVNFKYLPDFNATKECNSASFKYLQKKFENVAVVLINDRFERYRIGSMDENAILGKDYLLIQNNIPNSSIWGFILGWYSNWVTCKCWYAIAQKGNRKKTFLSYKEIRDNVYVLEYIYTPFSWACFSIRIHFRHFKKIKSR